MDTGMPPALGEEVRGAGGDRQIIMITWVSNAVDRCILTLPGGGVVPNARGRCSKDVPFE